MHWFNVLTVWMMFLKIFMIIIGAEEERSWLFLMIWFQTLSNKKLLVIIKGLFIRCKKLNISLVFITQSYFSVPKDVRLNSTDYLIMRINNKRELQNIVINHSANIDYNDFMKIYRECTNRPFNFLTIDTTLLASNTLRLRRNWRKTAKISAPSSNNLGKYEYLTSKDLGFKPSTIEQTKFEYSP